MIALYGLAAAAIALDQITKAVAVAALATGESRPVIDGVLHWTLQRNPGAAFGLFQRFPVVFTVLAFIVTGAIVIVSRRVTDDSHGIALGLILGGALGNLIDRLARPPGVFRGHVIDFIDFRVWPVFNLADASIVVGAFLLLIVSWRRDRRMAAAKAAEVDAGD